MNGRLLIDARSFLGKVWNLARPYWSSEERWLARGLLAAIVGLTLAIVYMSVLLNEFSRDFYNAIQEKNFDDFHALLLYFCFLAAGLITLGRTLPTIISSAREGSAAPDGWLCTSSSACWSTGSSRRGRSSRSRTTSARSSPSSSTT